MDHTIISKVNRVIEQTKAQLKKLESIRDNLSDPEISSLINSPFLNENSENNILHPRRKKRSIQFEKVIAFFQARNNEPSKASEIAIGTDLKKTAVSSLLYAQHADKMEKILTNDGVLWRLKTFPPDQK